MTTNWNEIVEHYESCLDKHGDSHLGVDWPNAEDALTRYKVMHELFVDHEGDFTILDYGCGAGHFGEYLKKYYGELKGYSGYDISEKFIALCREKFQEGYFSYRGFSRADYVVMNGVLTEKRSITTGQMWEMTQALLTGVWQSTNIGLAFNVMSKNVDWEHEELFHLSLDHLTSFLCKNLSRNFVIRNDYGLYEYTAYVYK